jgi:serine/threonine protein kinase
MRLTPPAPILQGKDDLHQLELIYQLVGSPVGELETIFKAHGDKLVVTKNYPPRLHKKFSGIFDVHTLQLLSRLLELDPRRRASAAEALDSEYFWHDPAPDPSALPVFDLESAFAMSEDERMREEHRKKQEERRELQQQQIQQQQQQQQQHQQHGHYSQNAPHTATASTGEYSQTGAGTGQRAGDGRGRGRGRQFVGQSKYAVTKPGSAAAAAAATVTTAAGTIVFAGAGAGSSVSGKSENQR